MNGVYVYVHVRVSAFMCVCMHICMSVNIYNICMPVLIIVRKSVT